MVSGTKYCVNFLTMRTGRAGNSLGLADRSAGKRGEKKAASIQVGSFQYQFKITELQLSQ